MFPPANRFASTAARVCASVFFVLLISALRGAANPGPDENAELIEKLNAGTIILTVLEEPDSMGARTAALIDSPIEDVWKVALDLERKMEFMPGIEKAEILSGNFKEGVLLRGEAKLLILKIPYYLTYTTEEKEDGEKILYWNCADPPPGMDEVVSYKVNRGSWRLKPFGDGKKTLSIYTAFIDIGDSLPEGLQKKLTELLAKRHAPAIIRNLRVLMDEKKAAKEK